MSCDKEFTNNIPPKNMSLYTAVLDVFIAYIIQFPIEDVNMFYVKEFTVLSLSNSVTHCIVSKYRTWKLANI